MPSEGSSVASPGNKVATDKAGEGDLKRMSRSRHKFAWPGFPGLVGGTPLIKQSAKVISQSEN